MVRGRIQFGIDDVAGDVEGGALYLRGHGERGGCGEGGGEEGGGKSATAVTEPL